MTGGMPGRRWAVLSVCVLAVGCAPAGVSIPGPALAASAPGSLPGGYHGRVVWSMPGGRQDTSEVRFDAVWRRTAAGTDTVWAFAGAEAGAGWTASGHLAGDSLAWSLNRMAGDAGVSAGFVGRVEPDGTVRGCSRPDTSGRWGSRQPGPRGAFVLRPRELSRPRAEDLPIQRCFSAAG